MASESVEYKTLIKCFDKLTIAFKSSPISIANELLANGFISSEVHEQVLLPGLGDDVKATRLVKCVTDTVNACPGRYYDFMSLPLFQGQCLSPIYDVITTEYGESRLYCNFYVSREPLASLDQRGWLPAPSLVREPESLI